MLIGRENEEIDVRVPSRKLTDAERKEYNLRSNKNTGDWDNEKLALFFDEEMLKEVGFEDEEIAKALGKAINGEEDDFDTTPPEEPKTKLGDIFELGDHRLMCGDSTDKKDVEVLMDGGKADMVFTDPPYNIAYEGGMNTHGQNKREMIKNDKMSSEDFYIFLEKTCKNLTFFSKGAIYICMSSSEIPNLRNAFQSANGHYQSMIIWVKNTFTLSRSDWQNQYEPILYGWSKDVVNHFFAGFRDEGNVWETKPTDDELLDWAKKQVEKTDIWRVKKPSKSEEHPTMKPVQLVAKALGASSLTGGGSARFVWGKRNNPYRLRTNRSKMSHDGTRPKVLRRYYRAMGEGVRQASC